MTFNLLKNPALIRESCHINGTWITAQSGKAIDITNPFDGSHLGVVPDLSADEVRTAVDAASAAQDAWAKLTPKDRANILHKWADLIDDNMDDLAVIMTLEQGKPLSEARGEVAYANSFIRWFAEARQARLW